MSLLCPRLVALDSSHWAKWISASFSGDRTQRDFATGFHESLLDHGWVPFLSWHNLEELLAIGNEELARRRVRFIRALPLLAWFRFPAERIGVGAITDITAAEAIACCEGLEDPSEIASRAKLLLLRFGTGSDALGEEDWIWDVVREEALRRSARTRDIVAIAPFRFIDDNMTFAKLCDGQLAAPRERFQRFRAMHAKLVEEIAARGDRRIAQPADTADDFFGDVIQMAGEPRSARELATRLLIENGLEEHELRDEATIRELCEVATFRMKLRVVAPLTGRTFEELRSGVRMERCPHWIIERDMRVHAPKLPERKGSDLVDGYLATLAAYVEHLFVDKRTAETFRRLPRRAEALTLTHKISKAGRFERILSELTG